MTQPFSKIAPGGAFGVHTVVSAAFFDLRSGLAGDLAQRLTLYGLRAACVVPDLAAQPERFREFAREANRGSGIRVFATRGDAVAWLSPAPQP